METNTLNTYTAHLTGERGVGVATILGTSMSSSWSSPYCSTQNIIVLARQLPSNSVWPSPFTMTAQDLLRDSGNRIVNTYPEGFFVNTECNAIDVTPTSSKATSVSIFTFDFGSGTKVGVYNNTGGHRRHLRMYGGHTGQMTRLRSWSSVARAFESRRITSRKDTTVIALRRGEGKRDWGSETHIVFFVIIAAAFEVGRIAL